MLEQLSDFHEAYSMLPDSFGIDELDTLYTDKLFSDSLICYAESCPRDLHDLRGSLKVKNFSIHLFYFFSEMFHQLTD